MRINRESVSFCYVNKLAFAIEKFSEKVAQSKKMKNKKRTIYFK